MRTLACLLLALPLAANACDWHITRDRINPMTGERECTIQSPTARIGLGVYPDRVEFAAASAYHYQALSIRVDENPPIYLGLHDNRAAVTQAMQQIQSGQRIRTSFRAYPRNLDGDAPICDLPALIQSCRTSR